MKSGNIFFIVLVVLAIVPITWFFLYFGKATDGISGEEDLSADYERSEGRGFEDFPSTGEPAARHPSSDIPASRAPVFKGFESSRYQQHDALIRKIVADFNRHRATWAGATDAQGSKIAPISVAQVKAHMIQETGGDDTLSRVAWQRDPLQVNVPGDWNPYKKYLGLKPPRRRNEGSLEKNLRAGVMLLSRKGFGASGQPAANRPDGKFDGWDLALQRYNGRTDATNEGRPYGEVYSKRIRQRAKTPTEKVPIGIMTVQKPSAAPAPAKATRRGTGKARR